MTTPEQNIEQHRDLVDEGEVLWLLADVPALLTSDEETNLRECVRRSLEVQSEAAEIMAGVAHRNSTDGGEANAREALGRWYAMRTFEAAAEEAGAQLTEH